LKEKIHINFEEIGACHGSWELFPILNEFDCEFIDVKPEEKEISFQNVSTLYTMIDNSRELKVLVVHGYTNWFYVEDPLYIRKPTLLYVDFEAYTSQLTFVITKNVRYFRYTIFFMKICFFLFLWRKLRADGEGRSRKDPLYIRKPTLLYVDFEVYTSQ
jgi:hypothetical protein